MPRRDNAATSSRGVKPLPPSSSKPKPIRFMKSSSAKFIAAAFILATLPATALSARPADTIPYAIGPLPLQAEATVTASTFFALARSDIENQKRFIIAQNLPMTEAEAAGFWALHRDYETDLGRLNARKFGLLDRYAREHGTMTDHDATVLAQNLFDLEESNTDLKRNYFRKFSKVMPVTKVARFFQIEGQLTTALDLQLKSSLPLIP